MFDRRGVLAGVGSLTALSLLPPEVSAAGDSLAGAGFLSCYRDRRGAFGIAVLSVDGTVVSRHELPGRGHGVAVSPSGGSAVVFARRPGRFAHVLALPELRPLAVLDPPLGRHFYGHGAFSPDGRYLYASENDFDGARGVIGVYDMVDGCRRIGEFDSGGIGPHQIILLSDGRTLAIANGGIETHPDFPRLKLNIPDMRPSLAYMDIETGRIDEIASLPENLHQLSLRHIAEAKDGTIWIGGQFEGDPGRRPPLIASHRRGGRMRMLEEPALYDGMQNYIGSIAVAGDGRRVVATAPRGGAAIVLDGRERKILHRVAMSDVCGVAPTAMGVLLTSGLGRIRLEGNRAETDTNLSWDNHAFAL